MWVSSGRPRWSSALSSVAPCSVPRRRVGRYRPTSAAEATDEHPGTLHRPGCNRYTGVTSGRCWTDGADERTVAEELQRILDSRAFANAPRCRDPVVVRHDRVARGSGTPAQRAGGRPLRSRATGNDGHPNRRRRPGPGAARPESCSSATTPTRGRDAPHPDLDPHGAVRDDLRPHRTDAQDRTRRTRRVGGVPHDRSRVGGCAAAPPGERRRPARRHRTQRVPGADPERLPGPAGGRPTGDRRRAGRRSRRAAAPQAAQAPTSCCTARCGPRRKRCGSRCT